MEKQVFYIKPKNAIEIYFNFNRRAQSFFCVSLKNCADQKQLKRWIKYFKKAEAEWWTEELKEDFVMVVRAAWKEMAEAEKARKETEMNKLPRHFRKYAEAGRTTKE